MKRGLKCPKCRQQTAYKIWGTGDDGRDYRQKLCGCGWHSQRNYFSLEITNMLRKAHEGT